MRSKKEFPVNKIKTFIKNIIPFNNRSDMPLILYVIKVILIFWVFKFASELAGEGIVLALHFACGKNPLQGEMFDSNTITLISYFGYGFMIGIIFLLWKLFQKKTPAELGFTKLAWSYFAGAAAGAVLVVISVALTVLTGAIRFNGVFDNINTGMVLLMLGGFVFQGAFEEMLCRGVVQQLLQKKSVPVAVGVSAALFTISHVLNMDFSSPAIAVTAVINLLLISLIFSLLTIRFRSIWAACGMHSIWNYILYSILGLNLSGSDEITASVFNMSSVGENILNGGVYGIEASTLTTAVLVVAATLLILFTARKPNRA
jgi:membrane protease YdiL (CAAX protease family)